MKLRLSIAGMTAILALLTGCRTSPSPPSSIVETYYPIELGNERNFLSGRGVSFYLGHRVESFRLKVRFVNPGRTEQWINGVTLFVVTNTATQDFRLLPPTADPDGSFWTQQFTANGAAIRIDSGGNVVDFQGGQPRFEIVAVERHFRAGSDRTDVPATTLPPVAATGPAYLRIGRLAPVTEVIGFSPGVTEAQHYRLTPGTTAHIESLYISPRLPAFNNGTGIKVHLSSTGFVSPDANVQWTEPVSGDSGIYTEFQVLPGQTTFVTVVSTVISPYLIRNTWLVEGFGNIVMERDQQMDAAPAIDLDAIRVDASVDREFNSQIADYLHATANYDRRIREAMTIASAFALDGSDGQMRYASAELHRDIDDFRNVDAQFSICGTATNPACRANASWSRINMFTLDLNDPITAGRTFHHEWGHWDYGLPDEYIDISGPPPALSSAALDPNSLMGTSASTEFCTPQNHTWAANAGGEADSCWTQIADQYPGVSSAPVAFSELSCGRYLDVLHKLEGLFTLTIH